MKTARLAPTLLLLAICVGWAPVATASEAPAAKPTKAAATKSAPAAASVAAEAAPAPTDPMEQLRRRLAERLQNQKSGNTAQAAANQQELLVVAKPVKASAPAAVAVAAPQPAPNAAPAPHGAPALHAAPAPQAAPAAHAAPPPAAVKPAATLAARASTANHAVAPVKGVVPVAAHLVSPPVHATPTALAPPHVAALPAPNAAHAAAPAPARARPTAKQPAAHGTDAHWDYTGPAGPQTWGGLKPEFSLCGNGQRQSPIDIRGGLSVDLEPVRFEYQSSRFSVIDNGHTVQANLAAGNAIEIGGNRFELQQLHFHRPSEERIDGRQFEMSVHLVHKDAQGKLAVVTLLLEKGPAQPAVQKVWNNLPLEKNQDVPARVALDLNEILPADQRYFTYMGSLTTPPCTEGVQWVVMRQPVTVAPEQIDLFARIYPMNARPVQQAAGRRIMQSN